MIIIKELPGTRVTQSGILGNLRMLRKGCNRMNERIRLVARLLDGEKIAVVCREFGISRKAGYKIFNHHKEYGLRELSDPVYSFMCVFF